jgi:hypothetical protein
VPCAMRQRRWTHWEPWQLPTEQRARFTATRYFLFENSWHSSICGKQPEVSFRYDQRENVSACACHEIATRAQRFEGQRIIRACPDDSHPWKVMSRVKYKECRGSEMKVMICRDDTLSASAVRCQKRPRPCEDAHAHAMSIRYKPVSP